MFSNLSIGLADEDLILRPDTPVRLAAPYKEGLNKLLCNDFTLTLEPTMSFTDAVYQHQKNGEPEIKKQITKNPLQKCRLLSAESERKHYLRSSFSSCLSRNSSPL